jgi:peptide/nickel transport system permease protein
MWGGAMLVLVALAALLAPLSPYDPKRHDIFEKLEPPSPVHPLGTDALGRDLLTRLLYGGRTSLIVAGVAVLVALGVGVPIGMIAGYFGGIVDSAMMRVTDAFLSLPQLFVLILLAGLLRETGTPTLANGQPLVVAFAIGTVSWMATARLIRASFLSVRESEYVMAAKGLGLNDLNIMRKQILPASFGLVAVEATLLAANALLVEAGLSFIGFGIHPRTPTWGNMLQEGLVHLADHPRLTILPGLMIFQTVIAVNFLGDALRDACNPLTQVEQLGCRPVR